MKKFNLKNYITKKKTLEFLDAKGFYIVLILCVGIITVTAYVVTKSNLQSYVDNTSFEEIAKSIPKPSISTANPAKPAAVVVEEKPHNNPSSNSDPKTNQAQSAVVKDNSNKEIEKNDSKEKAIKKQVISLQVPVLGDITQDFSKSHLVYSKTLEQWTTHEGIDIFSDRGTPVKAAADGIVENIYTDYKYGITVVINHGDGLKTKYCNLSTDSMIKKGTKVKKGEVISGIGNTAMFESGEQPHLHFEVLSNDEVVNPKNYLK